MKIFISVHEGFQNAPKLYGSEVRQPGKVDDFSSGLKEAGKVRSELFLRMHGTYRRGILGIILWILRWYHWFSQGTYTGSEEGRVYRCHQGVCKKL